jgi:hypothetical protein
MVVKLFSDQFIEYTEAFDSRSRISRPLLIVYKSGYLVQSEMQTPG